jgi:excisionase family DNA binding protein
MDKWDQLAHNRVMNEPVRTEPMREVMTPEQAADYLQVHRETIYRYIRQGKLVASKLGRAYRVPKRNLDLLLWATRTRPEGALRDYSEAEIAAFLAADRLDEEAQAILERARRTPAPQP